MSLHLIQLLYMFFKSLCVSKCIPAQYKKGYIQSQWRKKQTDGCKYTADPADTVDTVDTVDTGTVKWVSFDRFRNTNAAKLRRYNQ
jgi:hypothetical protein